MNRIERIFADKRSARTAAALMPFVCGGHPAPGDTARLLAALAAAGADVIEIGIPFSDPIADGPVIAAAMHDALLAGATPASVLAEVASARAATAAGLVAMVSISLVQRAGPKSFVASCAAAGIDGLIIPDLPLEEADQLGALARDANLAFSLLIAPTTPPDRAARIARACSGFVYVLARAGITGEHGTLDAGHLAARLSALRQATDLPLACGFGISTPQQVRDVIQTGGADAAIVGSALVRRISDAAKAGRDHVAEAAAFVRELAGGLAR